MEKHCKHCESVIDFTFHGNRLYCDDNCYYLSKLDRNKTNYQASTALLKQFRQVENILKSLYSLYGSDKLIPTDLLNNVGMNWTLFSATTMIDKMKAKVIGKYAYVLFNNSTLRIWKTS